MNVTAEPRLEVTDLSVSYGALAVLRSVSLRVARGEIVGLLGPNGHGKTTLLRAVSGLVRQQGGQVRLDGRDLRHLSTDRRRGLGLAHIPQGDLLFPDMSVQENLAAGAYSAWTGRLAQIEKTFSLFPELSARRRALAATLSGGERRMLAIARAMMTPATIFLVDEPSIGLSPSAIARVYETLRQLRDTGATILLVEETLSRLEGFADRVYLLDHGQIVAETTPRSIANDSRFSRAYLG